MTDIRKVFELWAGPDVKYVSHRREPRQLWISYCVPLSREPERVFTTSGWIRNGLGPSLHWSVRRIASSAMSDAYVRSGKCDKDMRTLLSGRVSMP